MITLAVDDKQLALDAMKRIMASLDPEGTCLVAYSANEALERAEECEPNVAFLDIEMPGGGGLELARKMKEQYPETNIVFVTAHSEYALKAHGLFPSGYLLKPATEENVGKALANLRHPVAKPTGAPEKLEIHCFGNFNVFFKGEPVRFKRSKTKELLAYLVDRHGSRCSVGELISILWEDGSRTPSRRAQVRNLISDLRSTLAAVGSQDVIMRGRDEIAIVPENVECDYYRFLKGDQATVNQYRGQYMAQYPWAELTTGHIYQSIPLQ